MPDPFEYEKPEPGVGSARVYEDDLKDNFHWALNEGGRHFDKDSRVHRALVRIARRLDELEISYAVVGGMALLNHGFPRFTEDVDLLVMPEDLIRIHDELEGSGYRPPFAGSKNLRDTELGVRIEFLVAGEFPGDGKPKPVAFPDPRAVSIVNEGIRFIKLSSLIELKIASGMTNTDRLKDLSDVQELIKAVGLGREYADMLAPYVRAKYLEICPRQTKYLKLWRTAELPIDANGLGEMAGRSQSASRELEAMLQDGVAVDPEGAVGDGWAVVFTYNPEVAHKYDMHPEEEFWDYQGPGSSTDRSD